MNPKYITKKALILTHARISSVESLIARFVEHYNIQPGQDATAILREKCNEAELVDLTGNNITNEAFSTIISAFPFPQVTELHLVYFTDNH